MKKFFYLFAASLVAFSFASCEPNKPSRPSDDDDPKPKKLKFQLDVNIESPTKATWTVTPSDTTAWYFCDCNTMDNLRKLAPSLEQIPEYIMNVFKSEGFTFDALRDMKHPSYVRKGEWKAVIGGLDPSTEYVLFVFPIDTNLNVKGDIVYQTFTTMPEGYVDLGLPSGTLWKYHNEPSLWNDYEDAIVEFGDAIPSLSQWEELINNCTWTYDAEQGSYIIEGANGYTISMSCGGYRYCGGSSGHPSSTEGWYWTSTSTDEDKAYAAFFKHYDTYDNITTDEMPKCQGFSVHLIYPVEPELW